MNVEHTGLAPGPSLIEGMGMFATRAFRAGERIWRVDDARTADPEMIARVERRETDVRLDYYPDRTVQLPAPDGWFNHSCDPNSYDCWTADGLRYKVARRGIAAGDVPRAPRRDPGTVGVSQSHEEGPL